MNEISPPIRLSTHIYRPFLLHRTGECVLCLRHVGVAGDAMLQRVCTQWIHSCCGIAVSSIPTLVLVLAFAGWPVLLAELWALKCCFLPTSFRDCVTSFRRK